MRTAMAVVGGLFLAGGLLGLALEAFLYFDGHYRANAEGSVRAGRALAGRAPDPERDEAAVAERVRGDVTRGVLIAGVPAVLGAGLLVAARRKTPALPAPAPNT